MRYSTVYRRNRPAAQYYCHVCNSRKNQNQVTTTESGDIKCLSCQSSGFVEKVSERPEEDQNMVYYGEYSSNNGTGARQTEGFVNDPFASVFGVPINTFVQNMFQGSIAFPMMTTSPNMSMESRFAQDFSNFFGQDFSSILGPVMSRRGQTGQSSGTFDIGGIFNTFMSNPFDQQAMDHIIQYVMENDPNRYGPPPAAKRVIDSLKTEVLTEESAKQYGTCAICTEDFKEGEKIHWLTEDRSLCEHPFHVDCIIPWLKEHNTCPVCRYELPTDDESYNRQREYLRTRMQEEVQRNVNARGNTSQNNSQNT